MEETKLTQWDVTEISYPWGSEQIADMIYN